MMRCGVVNLFATTGVMVVCASPQVVRHVAMSREPGDTSAVCGPCWDRIVALGGPVDGTIVADHQIDVACVVPEGVWSDDGCILPIPDTAEDLVDVAVPA